jgi:ferredoxin
MSSTAPATQYRAGRPQPAPGPRLQIDWTACDARGHCIELLPELLAEDPWGYPMPRSAGPGGSARSVQVPERLVAHARRAVTSCPKLALLLREG